MKLYGVPTPPKDEDDPRTLLASLASSRPSPEAVRRQRERERQAAARAAQATTPAALAAARKEQDDVWESGAWLRKAGMR
jgi:hypothetical protein